MIDKIDLILAALVVDLTGGILLAFEMIELLDKVKTWNSSVKDMIQSKKIELPMIGLYAALLYVMANIRKSFDLKGILFFSYSILILYFLIFVSMLSHKLLNFLEYLTKKFSTKRVVGILGVICLCLGFILQFYINVITN